MSDNRKIFYINFDTANLIDSEGAIVMGRPSISCGANPQWELHFCRVNNDGTLSGADLSEAISWQSAVDVDFLSGTTPMIRTLDSGIDHSKAVSGIITVDLDANTTTFFEKVNGRNSVNAYFEVRGRNSEDKVLYDYRFNINALGAVDPSGGDPLPPVSGGVTINDVYALLRASLEYEFSDDGTNWHQTQQNADTYYRTRYPEGEWGEAISLQNGQNAPAVQIKYSNDNSSWSSYGPTPTLSSHYMAQSVDGGSSWISGILFRGADGTNGIGYELLGAYNASTTYNPVTTAGKYECVTYEGSTYAYIANAAASGNPPTDTTHWTLIAAKGDTGSVDNITTSDITDLDSYMSGQLSGYQKAGTSYTIAQTDTLLAGKANTDDVYTTDAADATFASFDYLNQELGNYVRLSQWSNQNTIVSGQINYLSAAIDNIPGGGGGDLSAYTPLSTTQSISGTLQNEISTLSTTVENLPSSAIEGVNLNNERTLTVSNVAWVLAMPMRTTMPNANDTDQDFMFYVGDDILGSTPPFIKAHLYEKKADDSATPPSEDDITISIPDYNIYNVTLTKGGDGAWRGTSQQGQDISIVYYPGSPDVRCKYTYGISINNTVEIMGVNEVSDELPWQVYPWEIIATETTTPVTMSHNPHGGGGARTYHWEDISPWANNS